MLKKYILSLSILYALSSFNLGLAGEIVLAPIDAGRPNQSFFQRLNPQGKIAAKNYMLFLNQFKRNIERYNPRNTTLNYENILLFLTLDSSQNEILPPYKSLLNKNDRINFFEYQINQLIHSQDGIDRNFAEHIFLKVSKAIQGLNFQESLEAILNLYTPHQ